MILLQPYPGISTGTILEFNAKLKSFLSELSLDVYGIIEKFSICYCGNHTEDEKLQSVVRIFILIRTDYGPDLLRQGEPGTS